MHGLGSSTSPWNLGISSIQQGLKERVSKKRWPRVRLKLHKMAESTWRIQIISPNSGGEAMMEKQPACLPSQ